MWLITLVNKIEIVGFIFFSRIHFWGCLHFLACLYFWGRLHLCITIVLEFALIACSGFKFFCICCVCKRRELIQSIFYVKQNLDYVMLNCGWVLFWTIIFICFHVWLDPSLLSLSLSLLFIFLSSLMVTQRILPRMITRTPSTRDMKSGPTHSGTAVAGYWIIKVTTDNIIMEDAQSTYRNLDFWA